MGRFLLVVWGLGLAAGLVGCSQSAGTGQGGGPGAPHSLGQSWFVAASAQAASAPLFHGDAYAADPTYCQGCHGGSSGIDAFCSQCHFGPTGSRVPPGSAWIHGTVPHADLAAHESVCTSCHLITRSFVAVPAACHDCHPTGGPGGATHPTGQAWLDKASAPVFHGDAYAADPASCQGCHGGSSGIDAFCSQCHFGPTGARVPAGSAWVHGTVPHAALAAQEAVCNSCHTLMRGFQTGPAACHDCHATGGGGATHATGQPWLDKKSATFHGTQANTQGTGTCEPCHGADLKGGSAGVSCFTCHFTATGDRVPPGSTWVHGFSGHTSKESVRTVCQNCHDLNMTYGNMASCHNCH
ncbi:MAG: hypothetical protein HY900_04560 [Deltaproteobacteria bacterium]|nr:hypothetical protein [Deltaproteobacteria bacterium]